MTSLVLTDATSGVYDILLNVKWQSKIEGIVFWQIVSMTLFILCVVLIVLAHKKNTAIVEQAKNVTVSVPLRKQQTASINIGQKEKDGMLEFFISDWFPEYTLFQREVSTQDIQRVFPLSLNNPGNDQDRGWMVEVKTQSGIVSHYLLTPTIEKKLINSMSCISNDENPAIRLERVQTIEAGADYIISNLLDKDGYIVLSGSSNECYGGRSTGFVSIYAIGTGEKIKLQGSFTFPGRQEKGISSTGNALGLLRGVFGTTRPTVVVDYGRFDATYTDLEYILATAYFDLQTGALNQLVSFN